MIFFISYIFYINFGTPHPPLPPRDLYILGEVGDKCPGLFWRALKILRKLDFADIFLNSAGMPKVTGTIIKRPTDRDGDGDDDKVYLNITPYFYPFVHV